MVLKRCTTLTVHNNILFCVLACGVFGRLDEIRHVHTQMINWHGPTGTVFSVDIQPHKDRSKRQRAATGGADSRVQVWELKKDEDGVGCVDHLSELSRHDCAVNVVRFHPTEDILASASDDRCLFIWRLDTCNYSDAPKIFADDTAEEKLENRENWTVVKQIRGHGSEVYDIAWSPDARYLVSGTMDNTTYVWDTNTCRKLTVLQHHKGYVQGVAWDPCNKYVVTVSSDRACIVYSTKKFEAIQRITKMKSSRPAAPSLPSTASLMENVEGTTPHKSDLKGGKDLRMFLDTGMVDTFFRRPSFSPDGKLVAFPCGCYEMEDDAVNSSTDNPESDDKMIQINVVYIFHHNDFENPVMCLPTGNSPAIAIRFCPQLFKLRQKTGAHPEMFSLPYRMVYAVVTLDNILLYDTQQASPFACVSSIHYEQLTDASWSSSGDFLMVSSIDGFCTIITIDVEKLGECYLPPAVKTTGADSTIPHSTVTEISEEARALSSLNNQILSNVAQPETLLSESPSAAVGAGALTFDSNAEPDYKTKTFGLSTCSIAEGSGSAGFETSGNTNAPTTINDEDKASDLGSTTPMDTHGS